MAERKFEMTELGVTDATIRRINMAATLVVAGAVVGAAYWSERAYRRWCTANHPLAAPRARIERARTNYRGKRASLGEAMQIVGMVLGQVGQAIEQVRSIERL